MSQNLHFFDPVRWIIGENPGWFMFEIIIRTILIYVILQFSLRKMGRRMASVMTTSELAVVLTLGAAIAVPLQVPDRGILAAGLILTVAWAFQRGLASWTRRSRRFESLAIGNAMTVVEDGRILLAALRKLIISRDRLFSVLRAAGVEHLGQVRRVYIEATGTFSIYRREQEAPGLSIIPLSDASMHALIPRSNDVYVCGFCAATAPPSVSTSCPHCGRIDWVSAVTSAMTGA